MVDNNYSEGYYPKNDYSISPLQAEENKFQKILEFLGAERGDTILDLGSGTCGFGKYCFSQGINVIGFTLSGEQVSICNSKGLKAVHKDFTKYHPEFNNKADHIILLGSTEHIATGTHANYGSFIDKHRLMKDTLSILKRYFKKNPTKPQRIFYSGIHVNPLYTKAWELFILERAYGGTYMLNDQKLNIVSAANEAGYQIVELRDSTKEYFLATALNPNHFGNPSSATSKYMIGLFILGFVYPFAFYMWLYAVRGLWMWMFDGKHHLHKKNDYTLETSEARPITLWWYVGENIVKE